MEAKRVINGNYGQVWIDGEKISNLTGLEAKVKLTKVDVDFCGELWKKQKVVGIEGTGTLKMHKVDSRMIIKMQDNISKGSQTVCTIIAKLADPDAFGAERVCIKNVCLDELTIMNFEVKKNVEESIPFTFSGYEFLDLIQPQNN
ncbi:phage tail tube protein [Clostridium sp. DJ247]|uniref:phage tail tube protein n=1 Tax=Clostridium sp. DJ247 TaxID=2726188 RepID=UPI00162777F5|nr:phage tail tube protein [Clostridium sp. DJ247]MBC2579693.1 phage tail tube protein [Clostridium sp. DJ247]